jgi:hypothetical protein
MSSDGPGEERSGRGLGLSVPPLRSLLRSRILRIVGATVAPGLAIAAVMAPPVRASGYLPTAVRHVIVYHDQSRYACWPTDYGSWSWGDEIAVGFGKGYFHPATPEDDHPYDRSRPMIASLARSSNGGETWSVVECPEMEGGVPRVLPAGIDFTHPDLAIRVRAGWFHVSRDRGRSWAGPYAFPDFGQGELTSRTDYIVNGRDDSLFFLSSKREKKEGSERDGAFAVRTTDGGRTFQFVGWMTGKPYAARTVMPSTVRHADGHLVTILQRRFDLDLTSGFRDEVSWLDAYGSNDQGRTWKFFSRIAYPDTILHNGNPPSLVRLSDGRLVTVYGVRSPPCGIRARVSRNGGRDWGPEILVRTDGRNWDLGYCRSFARSDGQILTAYYYSTVERPEQHIAATIWTPPAS